MYLHIYLFI